MIEDVLRTRARYRQGREALAQLYRQRAGLDVEIARAEAEVEHAKRLLGGRVRMQGIPHGDESAYQRHIRNGVPFPEDAGEPPCGCRLAHAHYEADRKRKAEQRRDGIQTTIFDHMEWGA